MLKLYGMNVKGKSGISYRHIKFKITWENESHLIKITEIKNVPVGCIYVMRPMDILSLLWNCIRTKFGMPFVNYDEFFIISTHDGYKITQEAPGYKFPNEPYIVINKIKDLLEIYSEARQMMKDRWHGTRYLPK